VHHRRYANPIRPEAAFRHPYLMISDYRSHCDHISEIISRIPGSVPSLS